MNQCALINIIPFATGTLIYMSAGLSSTTTYSRSKGAIRETHLCNSSINHTITQPQSLYEIPITREKLHTLRLREPLFVSSWSVAAYD